MKHWSLILDRTLMHDTETETDSKTHRKELWAMSAAGAWCRSHRWKGTLDGCPPEGLGPPPGLSGPLCHMMIALRLDHPQRAKKNFFKMKESNPLIVTVQKTGPDCIPSTAGLENGGFFSLVLIWPSEDAATRFYLETFFE